MVRCSPYQVVPDNEERPSKPPVWCSQIAPSHGHELFYVGGLVYCRHCGSYSSGSSAALNKPCTASLNSGSRYRRNSFDKGKLPKSLALAAWPDGRARHEVRPTYRLVWDDVAQEWIFTGMVVEQPHRTAPAVAAPRHLLDSDDESVAEGIVDIDRFFPLPTVFRGHGYDTPASGSASSSRPSAAAPPAESYSSAAVAAPLPSEPMQVVRPPSDGGAKGRAIARWHDRQPLINDRRESLQRDVARWTWEQSMISENLNSLAAGSLGPAWQRASSAAIAQGQQVPMLSMDTSAEAVVAPGIALHDGAAMEISSAASTSDVDDDMLAQHTLPLSESGPDVNGSSSL